MAKFQQVYSGEFVKWTGSNLEEVQQFLGMFVFVGLALGTKDVLFLANAAHGAYSHSDDSRDVILPDAHCSVVIAPAYIGRNETSSPGRYTFHLYSDYGDAKRFERSWQPTPPPSPAMPASMIEDFKTISRTPARPPWTILKLPGFDTMIAAVQWTGTNFGAVEAFLEPGEGTNGGIFGGPIHISTSSDDDVYLQKGWWLIRCAGELSALDQVQIRRYELVGVLS